MGKLLHFIQYFHIISSHKSTNDKVVCHGFLKNTGEVRLGQKCFFPPSYIDLWYEKGIYCLLGNMHTNLSYSMLTRYFFWHIQHFFSILIQLEKCIFCALAVVVMSYWVASAIFELWVINMLIYLIAFWRLEEPLVCFKMLQLLIVSPWWCRTDKPIWNSVSITKRYDCMAIHLALTLVV